MSTNEQKLLKAGWISKQGHGSKQWLHPDKDVWMSEACAMMRLRGYSKFLRAAHDPDNDEYENGNDPVSYDGKMKAIVDAEYENKNDPVSSNGKTASGSVKDINKWIEDLKMAIEGDWVPPTIKEIPEGLVIDDGLFYPGKITFGPPEPAVHLDKDGYAVPFDKNKRNPLVDKAVNGNIKARLVKLIDHYNKINLLRNELPDYNDPLVDDCIESMIEITAKGIISFFSYR